MSARKVALVRRLKKKTEHQFEMKTMKSSLSSLSKPSKPLKQQLPSQIFKLDPESELRFEIEKQCDPVSIELKTGTGEVFGIELVAALKYEINFDVNIAIYTWHGCTIEVIGNVKSNYISKETTMSIYANCHLAVEYMRDAVAKSENGRGPVTMIVGAKDVGKSTLCKILLNYAVRMGQKPIYVDLDINTGHVAVPGTIGALSIERGIGIEGFNQVAPLAFHFGYESPNDNCALYKMIVSQLAKVCEARLQKNPRNRVSGMVINTSGWESQNGIENIEYITKEFGVNVILVIDHERLHHQLVKSLSDRVNVIYLPKSSGVVGRDGDQRKVLKAQRLREYFYGSTKAMYPHNLEIKWSHIRIVECNQTTVIPVIPTLKLLYRMLSVSVAKSPEQVLQQNITGFICVINVNVNRKTLTILSPQPALPHNCTLILSSHYFLEN